ncbi:MAG: sucrose-6-phosphate hydrolase [Liquorilactobacillus ghanensis]|uniref:sucrose-6-phosphate hydrolase n=1 Tax=Liquorilactobacillus ghanensis TaxID=399370 RepID=UPI0039EB675E
MKWTRTQRYLPYSKWPTEYLKKITRQTADSAYRPLYHTAPTSGLLNDPNGFSYFNGKWHLFYQSFPYGPVHGLKSWVHLISDDLVNWKDIGPALLPDTPYDSQGVYSGSAHVIGERLFLMYTGNVRDENWQRHPYQNGAWMDQNNRITKLPQPLFGQPQHTTDHFRDPQLLEKAGRYYVLLGAQNAADKQGKIALFASDDLKNWQDCGYLNFTDQNLGYMIECPNLIWVDHQPVLVFCPQGLDKKLLNYQNIYPNTYLIGKQCNLADGSFTTDQSLTLLDHGFDVYASQAFNAPDGQAYLVSWLGLPEIAYPTDQENWAHCLSLVKKLTIKNNRLYQQPVAAIKQLRQNQQQLTGKLPATSETVLVKNPGKQYELQLEIPADQKGTLQLFRDSKQQQGFKINFDTTQAAQLVLDRSQAGQQFAQAYGTTRQVDLTAQQPLTLDIFIDNSVCEVFVNGGEFVFSQRVFPLPAATNEITLEAAQEIIYNGRWWQLAN